MRAAIQLLALSLLLTTSAWSVEGEGGYAGAFLQVPIGARPTAMGGAYLALSDDGSGPLFNPAGLTDLPQRLIGSSYRAMQLDRSLGYASLILPTRGQSVLGINWLYAGSGKVAARDRNGRKLDFDLSFNNNAIGVLFAKRFEDYLAAGVKMTYFQADFADMTAFSVGIDFGLMLYASQLFDRENRDRMAIQDIRVGLTLKNLGGNFPWNSGDYLASRGISGIGSIQDDKIPVEIGLGGSARFFKRKLVIATDLLKNIEQGMRLHAGAEFFIVPELAARGGYSDGRLTTGGGYVFNFWNKTMAIDYAFSTDKVDEGSEHIFSFDFLF